MNIAVVGYTGMVGKPTYKWLKKQGHDMMGITDRGGTHSWEQINANADYIIIAVPTPFNWKKKTYKTNILEEVLDKINCGKKVIIKSTIVPGTTERLQKKYPKLYLLFNPEFLSVKTAWEDFVNPDRQIIGFTDKSYLYASEALHLLPQSPHSVIMKSSEAEIVKYVNNFHGALMVIFANFFYDISKRLGVNFETIKKGAVASKWVGSPMGRMYWEVFHKGRRGYGGGCFPKDINSLIQWCEENKIDTEIIKATQKANVRILKDDGLTEEQVERGK